MSLLIRFKLFLDELEPAKYYRFVALGAGILLVIFGLLFYMHSNRVEYWQKEIKRINRERIKAREFLERHLQVEQQKIEVDEILAREKNFKIKEYFSRLVRDVGLSQKLSKETEISDPQDLRNGYSEIKLDASFTSLSMQELVKLLQAVEETRRIYIKDLDITKAAQGSAIDVTLVIATLQAEAQA